MIVIVSNERGYSDQSYYFIEAPSIDAVEQLMKTVPCSYQEDELAARDAIVIGTSESITWLAGAHMKTMSLDVFEKQLREDGYL